MGFSVLGLIALTYCFCAGAFILRNSKKRSAKFNSFLAVAFSAPTILFVFFLAGRLLAYVSGCDVAYSFHEPNEDCFLAGWNVRETMALTLYAQLSLMIVVPVWFVFFVIIYAISTFFRTDSAEKKG